MNYLVVYDLHHHQCTRKMKGPHQPQATVSYSIGRLSQDTKQTFIDVLDNHTISTYFLPVLIFLSHDKVVIL